MRSYSAASLPQALAIYRRRAAGSVNSRASEKMSCSIMACSYLRDPRSICYRQCGFGAANTPESLLCSGTAQFLVQPCPRVSPLAVSGSGGYAKHLGDLLEAQSRKILELNHLGRLGLDSLETT